MFSRKFWPKAECVFLGGSYTFYLPRPKGRHIDYSTLAAAKETREFVVGSTARKVKKLGRHLLC